MTDRPIIFSAEMVRAILKGRKTQTRRKAPIRELNILQHPGDMITWSVSFLKAVKGVLSNHSGGKFSDLQARSIIASQFNPYGKPGDLLWVRETWGAVWPADEPVPLRQCEIEYRADLPPGCTDRPGEWPADEGNGPEVPKWRPSIHMPRWASRITLRITDIRVERLQALTENDAKAEGCDPVVHPDGAVDCGTRKTTFAKLWNKINGAGAWDDNPWVWAISFERVKP
jgi:hypothetical protein